VSWSSRPTNDLPFLELAILGSAGALVTGNVKHFKPKIGRCKMNVCRPHEFVKKLPAT
jgi:predicted nucleic acid-binding protein